MAKVKIIHGPNLNMLGLREPDIYGSTTLAEVNQRCVARGRELGLDVDALQSNSEGDIVTALQECRGEYDAIILNPGGLTHYSVPVRDAILACEVPTIECHLSNIHKREPWRAENNKVADVCVGQISGFGPDSYLLAVDAAAKIIGRRVR